MVAAMKIFPTSKHVHPQGESLSQTSSISSSPIPVDTYGGRVHVEWDPQAAVTPLGQLCPFLSNSLKRRICLRLGAGLPVDLPESQCPSSRRSPWDRVALNSLRASSVCPHYDNSDRWGKSSAVRHEESLQ
jgi:hypothetical protein